MLTAQQIHEKNFGRSFKGYDMDEVDAFLDEVIESFDKLSRENREFNTRLEALNTQIESYRGMENTMMHTMVTVHKAAEEITESAKREADEVYSKARQQADEMVERATQESEEMLRKAHEDSQEILNSYREEIKDTEEELLSLKNLLDEFKAGIHTYSDELLALIDQAQAPEQVQELEAEYELQQDDQDQEEAEPDMDYVGQYVSEFAESEESDSDEDMDEEEPYYGPVEVDEEDDIDME